MTTPEQVLAITASVLEKNAGVIEALQAKLATVQEELLQEQELRKVAELKLYVAAQGLAGPAEASTKVAALLADGYSVNEIERTLTVNKHAGFAHGLAGKSSPTKTSRLMEVLTSL